MGAGFQAGFVGITGSGAPASAVVTTNTRVKTSLGFIGTVADIVQFSGPPVFGNWIVPMLRCQVQSIPAINQTSTGLAYTPVLGVPTPGPMQVTSPDSRASGM